MHRLVKICIGSFVSIIGFLALNVFMAFRPEDDRAVFVPLFWTIVFLTVWIGSAIYTMRLVLVTRTEESNHYTSTPS